MIQRRTTATRASFGAMPDGTAVELFTLTNLNGLELRAINYGAIIVSLKVPDKAGTQPVGDSIRRAHLTLCEMKNATSRKPEPHSSPRAVGRQSARRVALRIQFGPGELVETTADGGDTKQTSRLAGDPQIGVASLDNRADHSTVEAFHCDKPAVLEITDLIPC